VLDVNLGPVQRNHQPGDTGCPMLVVEPGTPHTFLNSSNDYLHFVVQAPFVTGGKVDLTG
jgi:hypothetical protein